MNELELQREIYANSLSFAEVIPVIEARDLSEYASLSEYMFVKRMARVYGCTVRNGDNENFMKFLTALYHYGRVRGIRAERAKRVRRCGAKNGTTHSQTSDTI